MPRHRIADWNNAYANGANIAGSDRWPAAWAEPAQAFRDALAAEGRARLDIAYGERPRNRFDLFLPDAAPQGLIVFIHDGELAIIGEAVFVDRYLGATRYYHRIVAGKAAHQPPGDAPGGETDHQQRKQCLRDPWRAGLVAIICIGETQQQREAGATLDVLSRQVAGSVPPSATPSNTVIAYEPVWAIGTGLTPTAADVTEAHAHIREKLSEKLGAAAAKMRILYGGSVKPSNAVELLGVRNVDGALVGGASLKAADFLGIAEAYRSISG